MIVRPALKVLVAQRLVNPELKYMYVMFMFTKLAHAQNVVKLNRRLMNE